MQNGAFTGTSFPYVAKCPSNNLTSEFKGISDVYAEIVKLSEIAESEGFKVGEAIYTQSFFFADHSLLVDGEMQDRIKEFQFCKQFNCPPYPSLDQTPPNIIDDFTIIEQELKNCIERDKDA